MAQWNIGDVVSFLSGGHRYTGTIKAFITTWRGDVMKEERRVCLTVKYTDWDDNEKEADITVPYSALK